MAELPSALAPARDRILEAAEHVVTQVGPARLTLELVAQTAQVSKGGLLYHFPSKEALLAALAVRYVENMQSFIDRARTDVDEGDAAREIKACVLGMLGCDTKSKSTGAALLAAAANNLGLLDVIRAKIHSQTQALAASSTNFERAAIVTLAIDGLQLRESLRISPFSAEQRERIVRELLKLADEAYG